MPLPLALEEAPASMTTVLLAAALLAIAVTAMLLALRIRKQPLPNYETQFEAAKTASERAERVIREDLTLSRGEASADARGAREELLAAFKTLTESVGSQVQGFVDQLGRFTGSNDQKLVTIRDTLDQRLDQFRQDMTAKHDQMRREANINRQEHRTEIAGSLKNFGDSIQKVLADLSTAQSSQLSNLTTSNEKRLEALRGTVDERLTHVQENNAKQLELMRATVEEKLQSTLDRRLGESFKQVSDRLEQVHKGLGEMQALAVGVGDLKRVLANVKTRGGWGEVQLGSLLEEILAPEQFARNVCTKDSGRGSVEYAVKLPGHGAEDKGPIWLPIDSKFPMEDYQRLVEAQEKADLVALDDASQGLETSIKRCAAEICDRYLNPPVTTDFAIMFLPIEGLYAEAIRRPGLLEKIQRECRVVVAGPTTLAALLNALQMGFRTLAIQKRSSEIWNLLGAVKTEFGKFGEILDGVKRKLDQASNTMEDAARRSRAIERRLRDVQALPEAEASQLLPAPSEADTESPAEQQEGTEDEFF